MLIFVELFKLKKLIFDLLLIYRIFIKMINLEAIGVFERQ